MRYEDGDTAAERRQKKREYQEEKDAKAIVNGITHYNHCVWLTVLPKESLLTDGDEEETVVPSHRIVQAEGSDRFGEIGFVFDQSSFFDAYTENYGKYRIYRLPTEVCVIAERIS